ncbi:MAG: hypothetical protein WDW20_04640 [Neisseriaceae bacterium]
MRLGVAVFEETILVIEFSHIYNVVLEADKQEEWLVTLKVSIRAGRGASI